MLGTLLEVFSKGVKLPDYIIFTPLHYADHHGVYGLTPLVLTLSVDLLTWPIWVFTGQQLQGESLNS